MIIVAGLALSIPSDDVHSEKPETFVEVVGRAKKEMRDSGITKEQEKAYIPIINKKIYEHVTPYGYKIENLELSVQNRDMRDSAREDAWRLYLGLPQKYNNFDISDFRPQRSREETRYYFKIKGFGDYLTSRNPDRIKDFVKTIKEANEPIISQDRRIMGHFIIDCGQDERGQYLSYYDKWDLDIPVEKNGFFGRPFEIYDRIYYDPDTFEPVNPPESAAEPAPLEITNGKLQLAN